MTLSEAIAHLHRVLRVEADREALRVILAALGVRTIAIAKRPPDVAEAAE